jgi:KUP system potassium uptake protein
MSADQHNTGLAAMSLAALGVVYGDIGTSPLYAFKEAFNHPTHGLTATPDHVMGVLSLMFWALVMQVVVKYLLLIMRADNKGEGGILSLTSLTQRCMPETSRRRATIAILGLVGAAMFYGDAMITPAISILGAIEGLKVVDAGFAPYIPWITCGIIIALFAIQKRGTQAVGTMFGPVMMIWFITLAVLGVMQIVKNPSILGAASPTHAIAFWYAEPLKAFFTMGAVVLVVTGGEALYADMGHFGIKPIRVAWFSLVWWALLLNYFGQGALVLAVPEAVKNPFYNLAPEALRIPLIVLATAAAVIASQAVITGVYSMTRQAIQMGYLPRMSIKYTGTRDMGQIYVPAINWMMMVAVLMLVVLFKTSDAMAAAYGIAVTVAMAVDTILFLMLAWISWKWNKPFLVVLGIVLFTIDLTLLAACLTKLGDGGWVIVLIGSSIMGAMLVWKRGRARVSKVLSHESLPLTPFLQSLCQSESVAKVYGTAIFMTSSPESVPRALLHNLKHNKVLHERLIVLTIKTEDIPQVPKEDYIWIDKKGDSVWQVTAHYGFKEDPHMPQLLIDCGKQGLEIDMMDASFFVSRITPIAEPDNLFEAVELTVFNWIAKLSARASDYFDVPDNRVVEMGTIVTLGPDN